MNNMLKRARTILIVLFSALIYAVAMRSFVEAGNLFPGGFAGISRLISRSMETFTPYRISFGVIYFSLNAICTVFVYKNIGRWFTIYSVIWYSAASLFVELLPKFPVTQDSLLISVFGGLICGLAIGLVLSNNASSGGLDFLAIYASKKYNIPTWNYVLGLNVIILGIAGLLFGWNQALYSIIYQFCSMQVIDALHKRYKLTNLIIVTKEPDAVCEAFYHVCRHGITRLKGEGGYARKEVTVLFSAINTFQLRDVIQAVRSADKHAFIDVSSAERVYGNYHQKPLE